jgi:hypothetical protein
MIFVDAHVHIYDCFDLETFFDYAFANFQKEASRLGQQDAFTGILLLTETSKDKWFERLTDYADNKDGNGNKAIGDWTFHHTDENCSLCARGGKNQSLFLIAGRQIVTAEKLEVLALATDKNFKEGAPIEQVIQSIRDMGAIPVIPYGFGKWVARRGVILRDLLEKTKGHMLFLGDNSGRPNFLPRPSHFKQAEAKGIQVLPGSDSLPFSSECKRAGSFGFSLNGFLSSEHPAGDLKQIFMDPTTQFQEYGHLERPYRFFRNQLKMWLKL